MTPARIRRAARVPAPTWAFYSMTASPRWIRIIHALRRGTGRRYPIAECLGCRYREPSVRHFKYLRADYEWRDACQLCYKRRGLI